DTLNAVYSMAASNFHDITSGSNGIVAAAGYDLVTGRGSPYAFPVIRDLVYAISSASVGVSGGSGGGGSGSAAISGGTTGGKGWRLDHKVALAPGATPTLALGGVDFSWVVSVPVPIVVPTSVGNVGQSFPSNSTPTVAFPRPKADAAWWRKPDTE